MGYFFFYETGGVVPYWLYIKRGKKKSASTEFIKKQKKRQRK